VVFEIKKIKNKNIEVENGYCIPKSTLPLRFGRESDTPCQV